MRQKNAIRKKWFVLAVVVGLALLASTPGGAQSEKPRATEVGISPDEIRIAIVADVDSPLSPGVFQSQVDAIKAYAKYANRHGGVAGRKLAVDFFDSKLNPDEARNATIKACANDLAMVGTAVVFMANVTDMVGCQDKAGGATGLPDINTFSADQAHQCSPVSYGVSPPQLDCRTKDQLTRTYRASMGQLRYYLEHHKGLHGICIGPNDLKSTAITGRVHCAAAKKVGVQHDGDGFYGVSARAPQTALTPVVGAAKAAGVTYFNTLLSYSQIIALRKEAKLQGLDTVQVWDCSRSCYDRRFLEAGPIVEGHYIFLNTLPLEEAGKNKALAAYRKAVGPDKADGFGATAWASAILFHEAIDKIVARDGVNGITRQKLLDELSRTHAFDADGMLATTDIGARVPSNCYYLGQVRGGRYVRVNPKKPGTFDCDRKNLVTVQVGD